MIANGSDPSGDLLAVFTERAVALARSSVKAADASQWTFLCFSHAERTFAVELSSVLRVLRARRLTRIPGAPRHLERVFQESGRIVAALDASALFGSSVAPNGKEPMVLLSSGESWLGVRATRVVGTRTFAMDRLSAPTGDLGGDAAHWVCGIAHDLTIVLDGKALVRSLRSRKEGP